ncbi:hypothetical protein IV203_015191 [Nitzschia inconspicua]|uniref:Uncharacterized protein n=1 Tax=Nitzschia inconspicua TaxID=303405 RepID=A0A9K3PT18_9STRA|nr:hypothetical protein IV203_015191 [Nitzschia inconspicua]
MTKATEILRPMVDGETIPVDFNKSLEETESMGSFNESLSVVSFADNNDSQNCFSSYAFEMDLVTGDEEDGDPNQVEGPIRKPRRSFSLEDAAPLHPARNGLVDSLAGRCRSDASEREISSQTSADAAPPTRRLPQRNATMSSTRLNSSLSNLSGGRTPLSRQQSKLHMLSKSNHNSQSSIKTNDANGNLSRSFSGTRRRRMERTISGLTSNSDTSSIDGNSSFAQLQVGDRVMLANKELSTSAHLIRRMPRQQRPRRDLSRHKPSSSEEDVRASIGPLMDMIVARPRE